MSNKMFEFRCSLVIVLLAIFSCSDDDTPMQKKVHVGVVMPVGQVSGEDETFEVGPDGVFKSKDGRIEITIPSGALSQPRTIVIQPLENTAPNGLGNSYRLSPHTEFQKPVRITFYYEEDRVSFADGLAVASQNDEGIWHWPGNQRHDRTLNKVTIETTHFSDWSLFESMILDPRESSISPGEDIEIRALRVLPEELDDDLLEPLIETGPQPLAEARPLERKYIGEWKLTGAGDLLQSGDKATYIAPDEIPQTNPATITLDVNLHNGSKSFLLAYVTVVGCEIKLNGGPYSNATFTYDGTASANWLPSEGLMTIGFFAEGSIGDEIMVYITYPEASTGQVGWTEQTCSVLTFHNINDVVYQGGHMMDDDPPVIHPGFVNIVTYDKELGVMSGTFSGNFSIVKSCTPDPCISYGTVEGAFIARTN